VILLNADRAVECDVIEDLFTVAIFLILLVLQKRKDVV